MMGARADRLSTALDAQLDRRGACPTLFGLARADWRR